MKLEKLELILKKMLDGNITISARSITRLNDSPFKHASDLTRNPDRRSLVEAYQARQQELRALIEKTDKSSRTNLQARVARLEKENELLKEELELLVASHKAMLLAVGEMGGMAAWRRFFPTWEETRKQLGQLRALPAAEVTELSGRQK
ncbi:hypothetical protein [Atopomonas hussainii]|uniref:hypothetical protein n=1 Tax=Atopomonas hussainii TaxID=1429083 RepID=UPI0009003754|nr:hypothetical protein [Atopomonas hussainii]